MPSALACTTLTNIPPDRYERIQEAAEEKIGAALTGDSGMVADKGVWMSYAYDGKSILTLSVIQVPTIKIFGHEHDFISPQEVIAKVEKAIAGIA